MKHPDWRRTLCRPKIICHFQTTELEQEDDIVLDSGSADADDQVPNDALEPADDSGGYLSNAEVDEERFQTDEVGTEQVDIEEETVPETQEEKQVEEYDEQMGDNEVEDEATGDLSAEDALADDEPIELVNDADDEWQQEIEADDDMGDDTVADAAAEENVEVEADSIDREVLFALFLIYCT